jgi:hypothetical protein
MLLKRDIEICMPLVEDWSVLHLSLRKVFGLILGRGALAKGRIKAGYLTACSRPLLNLISLRRRRIPQSLNLQYVICRTCIGMQLDYLSVTQYDKRVMAHIRGKKACEAPEIATSIRLH